jgi:hypothetical protein
MTTSFAADIATWFLSSVGQADHRTEPYDHWLLGGCLPDDAVEAVTALPFAAPEALPFDGRRESGNSTRVFFNPEQQARFPVCAAMAEAFSDPSVISVLELATGAPISHGRLRIEYCQDVDGFWLEPHLDIKVKLFTMLIYLSADPRLHDAGTDIYDGSSEHKKVATVPYRRNAGMIFVPGEQSWHGFSPRPIEGVRQSLIVNYVTTDWRATDELC